MPLVYIFQHGDSYPNNFVHTDAEALPRLLTTQYGLTIESLADVLQSAKDATTSSHCTLPGIPKVQFYRKLHTFLKKWKVTHRLPKPTIGKLYLSIDAQLQSRCSTPYNSYKFIEKVVLSEVSDSAIMTYGADKTVSKLKAEFQLCSQKVEDLDLKVAEEMKLEEMEKTKSEFTKSAQGALMQVEAEVDPNLKVMKP